MASRAMPFKTAQDRAALSTRQRRVSQRHRTVLCLIDAKCRTAEAGRMALLAGVPESGFDGLQSRGLIALPPLAPPRAAPAAAEPADVPADVEALDVDRPLPGFDHLNASPDSSLPPSRTLQPESTVSADLMLDDLRAADPWPVSRDADADAPDDAVAEARELMANAVRTQAPVAGSLTHAAAPAPGRQPRRSGRLVRGGRGGPEPAAPFARRSADAAARSGPVRRAHRLEVFTRLS